MGRRATLTAVSLTTFGQRIRTVEARGGVMDSKKTTHGEKPGTTEKTKHGVAPEGREKSTKAMRGVAPQRLGKPTKRLLPADPTTPGSGAGSFPNLLYQGGPVVNTP